MRAKGGKGASGEAGRAASAALDDEMGFEISTKVKGLKKLKESSGRSSFGGDIYQPNTLELPYTLKHVRQKDSERPKESHRNPKGAANKVSCTYVGRWGWVGQAGWAFVSCMCILRPSKDCRSSFNQCLFPSE